MTKIKRTVLDALLTPLVERNCFSPTLGDRNIRTDFEHFDQAFWYPRVEDLHISQDCIASFNEIDNSTHDDREEIAWNPSDRRKTGKRFSLHSK
jgi:hypothetical protein